MLLCLGVKVKKPTNTFEDNWGVIQSAIIPQSELKEKYVAISYHYVREAINARIIDVHYIRIDENNSDICTKALGGNISGDLTSELMA